MLTCDHYLMPNSLREALEMWRDAEPGSRLVAGATDILPWAREGRAGDVHLASMIDVTRCPELAGVSISDGRVRLGANVAFQRFLTDADLKAHLPCMPYCAIWFADDQIREQATLAGNVVNASPAADGTPPLLAMNGEIELARLRDGEVSTRTLPVSEFVTGPGRTELQADEIVSAITCDSLRGYGGSFEKVGQRRSLVISTVCTACLVKPSQDGANFSDVRLAMGGIGPVPVRLAEIEAFLSGKAISRENLHAASQMTEGLINSRTRREYRQDVVTGFIERALEDALHDCGFDLASGSSKEDAHV